MSLLPPSPASAARLPPRRMALLFVVTMVSAAGNTALMSILPAIGAALQVPDILISLTFTWSALLWMFCAPYWARRSDRRGRKAMMAVGLSGFIASMLLGGTFLYLGLIGAMSATVAMGLFMLGRSLYGLLGSATPPAVQAYIASRTAPEERTRALSLFASGFGLGTVLGPAVAPLLIMPGLGLAGPCFAFAGIGVFTLLGLHLLLPDDTPTFAARGQAVSEPHGQAPDNLTDTTHHESAPTSRLRWNDPRIRSWVVAGMMGVHAQAVSTGIVGFLVLDRLALRQDPTAGTGAISVVMMLGAMATLLAQWGVIPNLRLGPRAAALWGMAISATGLSLLAAGQSLHGLALGYAVACLGYGMFRPGITSGSSLAVERDEQGAVAGISTSMAGSAFVITPAIGVWLYSLAPLAAFGLAVFMCLTAATICLRGLPSDRI